MEEELRDTVLSNDAKKIIWNYIKLIYLRKNHKAKTNVTRMFIGLNLKYMTKQFKILRLYIKYLIEIALQKN